MRGTSLGLEQVVVDLTQVGEAKDGGEISTCQAKSHAERHLQLSEDLSYRLCALHGLGYGGSLVNS